MRKERYNWSYSSNYTGDWYLLRAKFMNDWNFFVREVGLDICGDLCCIAWLKHVNEPGEFSAVLVVWNCACLPILLRIVTFDVVWAVENISLADSVSAMPMCCVGPESVTSSLPSAMQQPSMSAKAPSTLPYFVKVTDWLALFDVQTYCCSFE